jgi:hypothetical protein
MTDTKESFLCLHLNIRSMRENFDSFLLELCQMETQPCVIVLSEIWVYDYEIDFYKIDNYICYANCNDTYRAGGIAVYVKDNINVCHDKYNFDSADGIGLSFKINSLKIRLLAFYRFTGVPIDLFLTELRDSLVFIEDECVIYTGDINIDLTSPLDIVDRYKFLMNSNGFDSYINAPTRVSERSSSCLDHIFIRASPKIQNTCNFNGLILDNHISDHAMIELFAYIPKDNNENSGTTESKKIIDNNKFRNAILNANWSDIYECTDVNVAFKKFIDKIKLCLDKSLNTYKKINKNNKFRKAWMNNDLFRKIERKNALYKKYSKEPTNEILKLEYFNYRDNLKKELSETKENFYLDTCNRLKGNSKESWRIVDSLIGVKRRAIEIGEILNDRGELITDKTEIANEINRFFTNSFSNAYPNSTAALYQRYKDRFTTDPPISSFFLAPTSPVEIQRIIDELKIKKSPGKDKISTLAIKAVKEPLSEILSYIFNLSFLTGTYPRQLKETVVVAIFKGGDAKSMNNYRPIALLSVFAKIIEKLVKIRLQNFLNSINFYSSNQFGFRPGLGTEDAMKQVLSQFFNGINNSKKVAGLFLDIKKAYDCVNHETLLKKLYNAGIRGICNDWFKSFLSGRSQQVNIGGCLSDIAGINKGVPQGSSLSSELFLIYINDLCNGKFNGTVTSYADDTVLCYTVDTDLQLRAALLEDLRSLNIWLVKNSLQLNINKTKILRINLQKQPISFIQPFHDIECNNLDNCNCNHIEEVEHLKYLGITLDAQLNWNQHIQNLKKHLVIACRKFYYLRKLCTDRILNMLYCALVESRLQYGITMWGGAYLNSVNPLIIGQKFIIRVMSKKPARYHSLILFRDREILPLRYLYFYKVLEVFYRQSGQNPNDINYSHPTLRSRGTIVPPRPRKEKFRRFFLYVAPHVFNTLPIEIKNSINYKSFKSLVKRWLIEKDEVESLF